MSNIPICYLGNVLYWCIKLIIMVSFSAYYISCFQQLLSLRDPSAVGDQISIERQRTSQTYAAKVKNVPQLPLPFVKTSLTQVTFATGVSLQSLESFAHTKEDKSHKVHGSIHPTTGSFSTRDSNVITDSKNHEDNTKLPMLTIAERLKYLQQSSANSSELIIGRSDYDPRRSKVMDEEWEVLEKKAAWGPRNVHRENFKSSVLVMDHSTSNSQMPFCVVNGEPVMTLYRLISLKWPRGVTFSHVTALEGYTDVTVELFLSLCSLVPLQICCA